MSTHTVKPTLIFAELLLCERTDISHHHGFSLEKTAACWETCIQVPVCGLLPGADGRVHQKMVRSCLCCCTNGEVAGAETGRILFTLYCWVCVHCSCLPLVPLACPLQKPLCEVLVFFDECLLYCVLSLDLLVLFCTLIFLAGIVVIVQKTMRLLTQHLRLNGVVLVIGFVFSFWVFFLYVCCCCCVFFFYFFFFFHFSQELVSSFQHKSGCRLLSAGTVVSWLRHLRSVLKMVVF